jgi:hypothetical protein
MTITEFLERWGQTLFEAPLATSSRPDEPSELAEVRLAILDQIRSKSYRAGGIKVFPYDLIHVELRGVEESRQPVFAGRFFRKYLEQEVANALRDAGCRFPDNLRVDIDAIVGLPERDQPYLTVSVGSQQLEVAARPPARLIVVEGVANVSQLLLDRARTNIGRVVDVYRAEGIFRRNDLSFAAETQVNCSVSREHAHIQFDRTTGEYRLFNDRWYQRGPNPSECGTWIVRDGMSQEVHRTSRGTKLEHGDEIHFGRAVVIFEME